MKMIRKGLQKEFHKKLLFVAQPFEVHPKNGFQMDSATYGLQTQSCLQLFKTYYKIFDYWHGQGQKRPVCFMANEELMSKKWANTSHVTFTKNKKKLLQLGLIEVKTEDTWKCGKISFVFPTDDGWIKYFQIKKDLQKRQPQEQVEKKTSLSYSEEDLENAKIWFKALRKFWAGQYGKLRVVGDWKEKYELRADCARRARLKLQMNAFQFRKILETILASKHSEFFLKNVLGPNSFMKKWRNERTVAENLLDTYENICKEKEIEKDTTLSPDDIPLYENPDKTGAYEEDETINRVWDSMWDIIGDRLRNKFRSKKERDEYRNSLIDLCEEIVKHLHLRPGRISLTDYKLRKELWEDELPDEASYFYFLLDCYKKWSGFFSLQMLWNKWMDFWTKVWKLDHGSLMEQDLQQFRITKIVGD